MEKIAVGAETPLKLVVATRRGPLVLGWSSRGLDFVDLPEEPLEIETSKARHEARLATARECPPWVLHLVPRIEAYFEGSAVEFRDVPVDFSGYTDFTRRVLEETRQLSYGETCRYRDLASRVGQPKAVRAVGRALGSNRTPLIIPCHRVLAMSGLGGFSSRRGPETKRFLLELEGALVSDEASLSFF